MSVSKRSAGIMTAALVSAFGVVTEAHAANRGYPAANGRAVSPNDELNCVVRENGTLRNKCLSDIKVMLPVSVDAAATYFLSVYGTRTTTCTASCRPVRIPFTGGATFGTALSLQGSTGRAEALRLQGMPVHSPGDALFIECTLGSAATLFSYGWN
jgi:hypothetical protein